ncbi:uncharacterized protein NECHADRAFT_87934 [Fusarium vanettenii 77-13-4]|uniref:Rhodopsin domain-containing protein n=1 Tax=Fusarium vanettenii (strain ATCC MYA-4622 / CBS 123669 / FGSC 9596 / NRRL 45880 / 77-13-4) TaxID=660122 RepID=C7ZJU1_FUSV7|nr:uncharacterized protein NECHADRAFT_87934 [Fusarium vanettenii 77-13-4]EEU35689.1 hypothetical protein NECHADRAFT_87934 [Fusarium vanettenii 77-13-4]
MSGIAGDRRIYDLNIALVVLTTVIVAMRLYSRGILVRALGLDDLLACFAYVLAIALSGLEIRSAFAGAGTDMTLLTTKQRVKLFSLRPAILLIFFAGTCFMRLSILAFLPRLNKSRSYIRCIWVTGFVIVAISIIAIIWLLTQCTPVQDVFDAGKPDRKCRPMSQEGDMVWAHSIVGVFTDIALFILPIWIIRRNLIRVTAHTAKVFLVFAVGLFAIITGILRFAITVTANFEVNTSLKMARVSSWTALEVHVGIWCGCFAGLQPLVRLVSYKLKLRSRLDSTKTPMESHTRHNGPSIMLNDRDLPGFGRSLKTARVSDTETDAASSRDMLNDRSLAGQELELGDMDSTGRILRQTRVDVRVEEGLPVTDRQEVRHTWNAI